MKRLAFVGLAAILSGCAYNMTLMPRDSGKTYTGEMTSNGAGGGSMTLVMDGVTCKGPMARVGSNESFGLATAYGANNRGGRANAFATSYASGDVFVKAILTCSDGRGIRCDLSGRGASGGGVCADDTGRVFDALAIRK